MPRPLCSVLLALLLGAPSEALWAQNSSDRDFRATNAVLAEWEAAWRSDDAEKAADFYDENAFLVLPDGQWIRGRDEIRTVLEEAILPASGDIVLRPLDIVRSGRMAVSSGRFWFQLAEGGILFDRMGTYVTVFLLDGPRWRIRSQVFSEERAGM